MHNTLQVCFPIFLLVIVEAFALYELRLGGIRRIVTASLIFALFVVPILYYCIQYEGIGMTNFIWNLFSTLIMIFIGIHFFDENIKPVQRYGIAVSVIGMLIIAMS